METKPFMKTITWRQHDYLTKRPPSQNAFPDKTPFRKKRLPTHQLISMKQRSRGHFVFSLDKMAFYVGETKCHLVSNREGVSFSVLRRVFCLQLGHKMSELKTKHRPVSNRKRDGILSSVLRRVFCLQLGQNAHLCRWDKTPSCF